MIRYSAFNPIRWLIWLADLDDGKGNPSFAKLVALVFVVVTVKLMLGANLAALGAPTVALVIALLAASFGRSVFLRFLERNTFTNNTSANLNATADLTEITKAVLARRDSTRGTEASGKVPQVHDD